MAMNQHLSRAQRFIATHTDFLSHADASDPPNTECPVCLDGIEEHICVKIISVRGCTHLIGLDCLEKMLDHRPDDKKECPMCRTVWMPENGDWQNDPPLWQRAAMPYALPAQPPAFAPLAYSSPSHVPAPSPQPNPHQAAALRFRPGDSHAFAPSTRSGLEQAHAPSARGAHRHAAVSSAVSHIQHPNGGGRPDLVVVDGVAYEWTDDAGASAQANASLPPAEQQRIAYLDGLGPQGVTSGLGGMSQQRGGVRMSTYEAPSGFAGHHHSWQPVGEYDPPTRQTSARPSRQQRVGQTRRPEQRSSRIPVQFSSRYTESRAPRCSHHHSSRCSEQRANPIG
jgi:hypothetical protein